MAVARLLNGEGRVRADRHLLALAVQVVLEAPGLRARRHDLQHQAAAIGQVVALVLRLRTVDRRGLQDVVDVSHVGPPNVATGAPVAPNVAPSRCDVKKQSGIRKTKTPVESTIWGFCWDHPGRPETPRDRVTCGRSSPDRSPSTTPGWRPPSAAQSHR